MDKSGLDEKDLCLVAKALIEMFGDEAVANAASRVDDYRTSGNSEGEKFWQNVHDAISEGPTKIAIPKEGVSNGSRIPK